MMAGILTLNADQRIRKQRIRKALSWLPSGVYVGW